MGLRSGLDGGWGRGRCLKGLLFWFGFVLHRSLDALCCHLEFGVTRRILGFVEENPEFSFVHVVVEFPQILGLALIGPLGTLYLWKQSLWPTRMEHADWPPHPKHVDWVLGRKKRISCSSQRPLKKGALGQEWVFLAPSASAIETPTWSHHNISNIRYSYSFNLYFILFNLEFYIQATKTCFLFAFAWYVSAHPCIFNLSVSYVLDML